MTISKTVVTWWAWCKSYEDTKEPKYLKYKAFVKKIKEKKRYIKKMYVNFNNLFLITIDKDRVIKIAPKEGKKLLNGSSVR
jgi:hypothetical protein